MLELTFTDVNALVKSVIRVTTHKNEPVPIEEMGVDNLLACNLILNGQRVTKRCSYKVTYTCPMCDKVCITRLCTFANKLKRTYKGCKYCFHSEDKTIPDLTDNFKAEYFKKELTLEEFERIRTSILSFQHGKFENDPDVFDFAPIVQCGTKFMCMMYDKQRCVHEELIHLTVRCEKCKGTFPVKFLHALKNVWKVYCSECGRIKSLKFGILNGVVYRTKLELKFLQLCEKNKLAVENKDGELYLTDVGRFVFVRHKKFKKMKAPDTIYSDEMPQQIHLLKKIMPPLP
jgi:hypothetical protein